MRGSADRRAPIMTAPDDARRGIGATLPDCDDSVFEVAKRLNDHAELGKSGSGRRQAMHPVGAGMVKAGRSSCRAIARARERQDDLMLLTDSSCRMRSHGPSGAKASRSTVPARPKVAEDLTRTISEKILAMASGGIWLSRRAHTDNDAHMTREIGAGGGRVRAVGAQGPKTRGASAAVEDRSSTLQEASIQFQITTNPHVTALQELAQV